MITTNPDVFKEGVPNASPQGAHVYKEGDLTLQLNYHIDMRLADTGESIRHFYIPLEAKMKIPEPLKLNHTWGNEKILNIMYYGELISLRTKNTQVYSLKPTKLEKNEGMLIDGALGLQLNPIIKKLKKWMNRPKGRGNLFPSRKPRAFMYNNTKDWVNLIWP